MGENQSAQQLLEQHKRDMGPELGTIYNTLRNEVKWAHAKWSQYQQLYVHSPERIALLNKVAGFFFALIQDSLLESVILDLARLTDPPQSMGKDNLTLLRLPNKIESNPLLKAEVNALVHAALAACESARAWRHRRLAHRDLALAVASATDPLPSISYNDIEAALAAIRAVLNCLDGHYCDSETHYITGEGEADSVVYHLSKGMRADERKLERLRQGKLLPEDSEPSAAP